MSIDFSFERWAKVKKNYRRWWAGELDRPLIAVTLTGYDPGRSKPELSYHGFTSVYDPSAVPVEAIVDIWDYNLSCCRFMGDAFPCEWPNFGPGVIASFLGCQLRNTENTVWFSPEVNQDIADIRFDFNPDAFWFKRIADLSKAAMARWQGLVQVGITDLGGNLDILSSFRPGEKLLLDLYDSPEQVKTLTWDAHEIWFKFYNMFADIMAPLNPGYTAWTPIFSESTYYMLQCDFAYMIGPDMFDEFVKPEIAAACKRLTNPFYHLDGVGQLPHLDSLLDIPELKGVQWVPGSGQPDVSNWPDVYRKIRDAGKLIQVFGSQCQENLGILDTLANQLGSAKGIIVIGSALKSDEEKVRALLKKYGVE